MSKNEAVKKLVQKYQPKLIEAIKELVSTPSANEVDDQILISNKIQKIAQDLGFSARVLEEEGTDEKAVFVGEKFDVEEGILMTTGFGTVNLGEHAVFQYDPIIPVVEGDKLYGSGAWKNKGNVALTLFAKKILSDLGHPDVIKMVYSNEIGSKPYDGLKMALRQGVRAEMHLVSCPVSFEGDEALLYVGCRGMLRLKVNVFRRTPDAGPAVWQKKAHLYNPIEYLFQFWSQMQDVFGENQPDQTFPAGVGNNQALVEIHGGTGHGSTPSFASAKISMLSVFSITNDQYLEKAKQVAELVTRDTPIVFEFEVLESLPAVHIPDNDFTKIYEQKIGEVLNYKVKKVNDYYIDGISLFVSRGWKSGYAVTLTGKNQNTVDEYLDLNNLAQFLELLVISLLEYKGLNLEYESGRD